MNPPFHQRSSSTTNTLWAGLLWFVFVDIDLYLLPFYGYGEGAKPAAVAGAVE